MAKRKKRKALPCDDCGAKCCRYIATHIDRPTTKLEHDHIRWYLMHSGVYVFIDHDSDWYLEFETSCSWLADDHSCLKYESRPRICQEHGEGGDECEHVSSNVPHEIRFTTSAQYEKYLDTEGIKWRWKRNRK